MSLIEFTTPLTDSFGYGSIPAGAIPPGAVVLAVADIDDPSPELSLLGASQSGSMVVAIQEPDSPGGHMPFTQYVWNEMPLVSPSASAYGSAYDEENIPYLIDSVEGGQWIASGGKYSYQKTASPSGSGDGIEAAWPVGSIFLSVLATNPGTLLGFGTWERIAEGQFLVGQTSEDEDFDTAEKTGGEKTHTLTSAEMPEHTHVQNPHQHDLSSIEKRLTTGDATTWDIFADRNTSSTSYDPGEYLIPAATAINQNTGGGAAHNNLPPYVVVYMWKRTE